MTTMTPFPERDPDELLTLSEVAEILKADQHAAMVAPDRHRTGVLQDRPPPGHHRW